MSKIEWTEKTWNPTTGCNKFSPGCLNCYAEKFALRLQKMGVEKYIKGFDVAWRDKDFEKPYEWHKPRLIFVNSMSDLFHENNPIEIIKRIFKTMNETSRHTYQILTKRIQCVYKLADDLNWTDNIWMGSSIELEKYRYRIDDLRVVPAKHRFLSLEPLLGPIPKMNLEKIDWVIVGGESGPEARPMEKSWVIDIRDQCLSAKVPFFFKQWGGVNKNKSGCEIDGLEWKQYPNGMVK